MQLQKKITAFLLLMALGIGVLANVGTISAYAVSSDDTADEEDGLLTENCARPSTGGALRVDGTHLVDKNGDIVRLQGLSTHGITWYPETINQGLFYQISDEWGANLIRLPVYSQEYVNGNEDESMELVENGIDYAINADMYVIVDWHILEDSDPNTHMSEAIDFFNTIARKYADVPNIIYEICNEPNGKTTWEDICNYAQCVIPVIKNYNPDAVICVGTPDYDRELDPAIADPIEDYTNIMYSFHFYAASHKDAMRAQLKNAIDSGLPVFVTECGLCEEDGDGTTDFGQSAIWFEYLEENEIPYTIWSLSDKEESASMIKTRVSDFAYLEDSDLTAVGKYVKILFSGQAPSTITVTADENMVELFLRKCRLDWFGTWEAIAGCVTVFVLLVIVLYKIIHLRKKHHTYHDYVESYAFSPKSMDDKERKRLAGKIFLVISIICSLIYLIWRVVFSIPVYYGVLAVAGNIILLIAELIGFIESLIHYYAMMHLRDYPLPKVQDDEFPDVDIFIATYNEPAELLRKTIIGCKHIKYPDLNKVHIYLCDDKRRPEMRALAQELGINYFDRPDNKGAKAGNLNHAMGLTSSPYIVTLDADMIPMENFLLQTIPYYIDAEKHNIPLGLIQTPQCFYTYDVFQHNLYAENNIPDEQDFFYRTIEPAKTYTNSVIYGGSNTILSRKALDSIGGFYTESITEDFATGMLIEANGFVSLGLPDPLASGMAPSSFEEHIQQRTRWGRGVLVTAKKLKFMRNKNLTMAQKLSYLSSVTYWFSPIFNMIYLVSPLLYSVFGICVFRCTWIELLLFWLPMFLAQNICLRLISSGRVSTKWSSLQEISVMPFLFIPILQEMFGVSLTTFKVTDKSKKSLKRTRNRKEMIPFLVFMIASIIGIVRVIYLFAHMRALGLLILLFWMARNLYFVIMGLFLVDGRDSDGENVKVKAAEFVTAFDTDGREYGGITTLLTEHNVHIFLDEMEAFRLGESICLTIDFESVTTKVAGTIVEVRRSRSEKIPVVYTVEILDFNGQKDEYVHALYNRVPTMPQTLSKDRGFIKYLVRNLARRIGSID